jgi:hypothetical protein
MISTDYPPPPYSIVVAQPVVVITPKKIVVNDNPRKHLCMCERGCECCINHMCCIPARYSQNECPTTCSGISSFRVYCTDGDNGICCGVICFPITLVLKLLTQVPCVSYNICRNLCNCTKELDYIP